LAPAIRMAAISRRKAPSVPRAQVTKNRNTTRNLQRDPRSGERGLGL
jgi:hypothetical protein